jgi:hypothetical protein
MVAAMSEAHRYKAVKLLTEAGNKISYTPHGPWMVPANDYDRDTQALKTELSEIKDSMTYHTSLIGRTAIERDTLRTANQRLEGEVARLREALELWLADYDEVAANPDFEPFPHVAERVAKTRAALRGNGGE